MTDQIYCVLDYETFSKAPLSRTSDSVGAFEYSVHESTEILCAAWKIGTRKALKDAPMEFWAPAAQHCGNFAGLYQAFMDPKIVLVAHNAFFEQVITRNVFAAKYMYSKYKELQIPPERWLCTASLAAALALPRNLEGAALALKLPIQKDMDGRRLIMKWCKPRKPTKNNPNTRHDDPEEYKRIVEYCKTDVATETLLFLECPPLVRKERAVWILDQRINLRGFNVDRPFVKTVLGMIEEETKNLDAEVDQMTFGQLKSAKQIAGVSDWLEAQNVFLPNLQAKTIEDTLNEGAVEGDAKRMLEIRQAVSKTSTAKYLALEQRSRHDGRLRDILLYHGSSTGRWAGSGVQPQNFPRGNIKNTIQAAEIVATGDLELIRLLYGDPMNVFSSCIRNAITAPPGKTLDCADYAAIEARVLFWVAKHEKGLQAFREGRDLYKEQAGQIYGKPASEIKDGSFERFLGKSAILGCGYSMGPKKFAATCKNQGQEVSEELAELAVKSYRQSNQPVVNLWANIGRAACNAVEHRKKFVLNYTSWYVQGDFLFCELPSGRRLAYYGPRVTYESVPWSKEEKRPVLSHWGVDPFSHKWAEARTYGGKLVENVVQAIARDLMAEAMLRIETHGAWQIVLSVHDELVAERSYLYSSDEVFRDLMAELPDWATGLPVAVTGWSGSRYKKG